MSKEISEVYNELLSKGYSFSYNNRSKKLEVAKDNNTKDLQTLADVFDFNIDELKNYFLSLEENISETTEQVLLHVPRRHTNKNDVEVYGGNLKAIIGNNSISYAVRDPKTNCWRVVAKNSEQLSSLLSLNDELIDSLINEVNEKLARKKYVNINELPRQMFLYNKAFNLGGVFATKLTNSNTYLSIEHFTDKNAFFDNDLVDQYIFTPNNPLYEDVITEQPEVITNDPNVMTISFFDKDGFIERCKTTFGDTVPETPNCDSWLEKFEDQDKEIIKDFIWTIFDTSAQTAEALWIYDEGGKGKSTMNKFIKGLANKYIKSAFNREMVQASGKSTTEEINNRFNSSSYYDKRVIIFPDCKNTKIAKTEFFHTITGGDYTPVEDKHEKKFSFKTNAKIIICSNAYPAVDISANNEVRRLLIITVKDPFKELPRVINDFENYMLEEADAFMYKCYLSFCNRSIRNNGITHVIQTTDDKIKSWTERGEIDTASTTLARNGCLTYDRVFEITHNENDKLSYADMEYVLSRTTKGFVDMDGSEFKWEFDKRAISQFLLKECRLENKVIKVGGKSVRYFIGVRFIKALQIYLSGPENDRQIEMTNEALKLF